MTVLYSDADVGAVLTPGLAIRALETAMIDESHGNAEIPGRLNAAAPQGWIRLMPAVIQGANGGSAMGLKVMNLNRTTGVRYVVLLYEPESGELAAIMDAARLTRIRTAAVTAIACRAARPEPLEALGLLGSGNEAAGHAEVFKATFPDLKDILVYSPRAQSREGFAERMSQQLGIEVRACSDPREPATLPVSVLGDQSEDSGNRERLGAHGIHCPLNWLHPARPSRSR